MVLFFSFIVVLGGGTLWYLQRFLQCIKHISMAPLKKMIVYREWKFVIRNTQLFCESSIYSTHKYALIYLKKNKSYYLFDVKIIIFRDQ
jgi:hypothetical protein